MTICERLGIDDPIAWFNATDPATVDLWIAHYQRQHQQQADYERKQAAAAQWQT